MEVKIKLKIKGVEIELDLKETEQLKRILENITGREVIKEKEYVPYPYPEPYRWRYPYWDVTWSDDTTTYSDTGDYTVTYTGICL